MLKANLYKWESMERESVTDVIDRSLISGERSMLAHLYLRKGAVVPLHSHDNEQFTYILKGVIKFLIGENGEQEVIVEEGQVLHIPPNVPHSAEALEDTIDLDVFTPIRQDWLQGTDSYFHEE